MDNLEVTASFRSDDYSDVGESDSFKLGALWIPMEGTIVKLNTGEGFRAPTMITCMVQLHLVQTLFMTIRLVLQQEYLLQTVLQSRFQH